MTLIRVHKVKKKSQQKKEQRNLHISREQDTKLDSAAQIEEQRNEIQSNMNNGHTDKKACEFK